MGWLSTLGKIGAVVGAPFTGGASLSALPVIDALGQTLGAGAANAAAGRRSDSDQQARMNATNNAANLNAAQFNLAAPGVRTGQVARGDLLSSMQDTPLTGDPRIDKFAGGGLRPSAFGPDTRKAGDELKKQALLALMSKSDMQTPQQSSLQKPGFLEQAGGAAGTVGGILGALGTLPQRQQSPYGPYAGGYQVPVDEDTPEALQEMA